MANKKKGLSLRKLIYNDKYLIGLALVLAVLIWIFTSLSIGTAETKTLKLHMPIELSDEVSEQLGMQYYTLQDTVDLSVTISGPKYVIGQVDENDLAVRFDTSNVNRTGEQSIPIIVTNNSKTLDYDISSTYPNSIQCYFDANMSKTFDVKTNYDPTKAASGYYFGTPVLSDDKVIVTGPKTYVDKIDEVSVTVDFGEANELTEMYNADCKIQLSGAGAYDSYLSIASKKAPDKAINTVSVTLPILKNTTLPVAVQYEDMPEDLPKDALQEQYSVSTISCGVLDSANITSAIIGTVDFSSLSVGRNTFTFDITNLSGIALNEDEVTTVTATITVPSTYQAYGVSVNPTMVEKQNESDEYTYTIKSLSNQTVTIIAPKGTKIDKNSILLTCDMSGITTSGTYPVTISIKDGKNMWVYGKYSATINVAKKK